MIFERLKQIREWKGMEPWGPRERRWYQRVRNFIFLVAILLALIYLVSYEVLSLSGRFLSVITLSFAIVSLALTIFSFSRPESWFPDDVEYYIKSSSPMDWEYHENSIDEPTDFIYKPNRDIKTELEPIDNQTDFHESWVNNYPNSDAKKRRIEVTHRGRKLKNGYIVAVDGQDHLIPLPTRGSLELTEYEFHLGEILNIAPSEGLARDPIDHEIEYLDALDTGGITVESDEIDVDEELRNARAEQRQQSS